MVGTVKDYRFLLAICKTFETVRYAQKVLLTKRGGESH
jgi:hypothetical protein